MKLNNDTIPILCEVVDMVPFTLEDEEIEYKLGRLNSLIEFHYPGARTPAEVVCMAIDDAYEDGRVDSI